MNCALWDASAPQAGAIHCAPTLISPTLIAPQKSGAQKIAGGIVFQVGSK
ncbi:MAG TPA: hypothetical protein VK667_10335 [Ktedonobacteraceae bacterium]|nr:hypothetical protein [Ktedonobacteraceae bacterium]